MSTPTRGRRRLSSVATGRDVLSGPSCYAGHTISTGTRAGSKRPGVDTRASVRTAAPAPQRPSARFARRPPRRRGEPRKDDLAYSFPTGVKRRTDCLSMILGDDIAEQHMLAWRQEPGELDPHNPLVTPARPWDSGSVFAHGTFAHDPTDGLWKAWHVSTPLTTGYFENYRRVTYLTSDDGVEWTRPDLDLCPQPGYPRTNILLDFDSGGPSMYSSVMIDPDAEPDRRYEMFVMRDPSNIVGGGPGFIRGLPPPPPGQKQARGMYRYFSPNGINWTVSEGPVLEVAVPGVRLVIPYENPKHTADTTYVFREADGTYMATHKLGEPAHPGGLVPYDVFAEGRRVMARRTSPDGSNWSPFETIIQPRHLRSARHPDHGSLRHAGAQRVPGRNRRLHESHADDGTAPGRQRRRANMGSARTPTGGRDPGRWATTAAACCDPRTTSSSTTAGTMCTSRAPKVCTATRRPRVPRSGRSSPPSAVPSWAVNRYWAAVSGPGGDVVGTLTTNPLPMCGKRLVINAATSTVTEGELHAELLDPGRQGRRGASARTISYPGAATPRPQRRAGPAARCVRWNNAPCASTCAGHACTGTPGSRHHGNRLAPDPAPVGPWRVH